MRGSILCRKCGKSVTARTCRCAGDRPLAVRVYMGPDPETGRERQKWFGGYTKVRDAEAKLALVAVSPDYGSGVGRHGSMRLRAGDYMEQFIAKAECCEQERKSRLSRWRVHVAETLAHVPLARVAPATVERLLDGLKEKGLSGTTRLKVWQDLDLAFRRAVRLGLVSSNPCEAVEPPKRARFRPPVAHWTREDRVRFFAACEKAGDAGLLFLTAYYTTARQGEVLGLDWRHVDFEGRLVVYVQDLDRSGGDARLGDTKTEASDRTVLLPRRIMDALRELRNRQMEERLKRGPCPKGRECRYQHCQHWHEWALAFAQPNGKPLVGRDVTQRALRKVCEDAGVPRIRFHDLKWLGVTVQSRRNVNPGTIKERAGHASAAFTQDRYRWAALDAEGQEVAVEALEEGTRG